MRKITLLIGLTAAFVTAYGQSTRMSPQTMLKAHEIRQGRCTAESVQAFATLAEGTDLKMLDAYGVTTGTMVGRMATVQMPVKRFDEFVASGLCTHLDVARPVRPLLDKVRQELGVGYIHHGVQLPQGYDGTGVVVGVIDVGFEYGHPTFYDTTGTTLRIKRVWQQRDMSGSAPAGFSYGTELTTQEQILAAVTDLTDQGHGSHTAGIAAGCGAPNGNGSTYRGMAPAADIVMVATNMSESGVTDGIKYIHRYARSVGKPCVINISLGTVMGPHDGLGPADVMIENYLHATPVDSLVVVVSAGNSGGSMNHMHKSFSPNDTLANSFMRDFLFDGDYSTALDCWGDVGDTFSVSIALYALGSGLGDLTLVAQTPLVPTVVDSTYTCQLTNATGDVYEVTFAATPSGIFNERPEIQVEIYHEGTRVAGDYFGVTVTSQNANVHLWSDNEEFYYTGNNIFNSYGDDDYTIGGVGANSDAVISVGSYASRNHKADGATLTQTLVGELSSFSSHGPTYDGRVKPDICTPGQYLVSAVNAPYVPLYLSSLVYDSMPYNDAMHYYALMQGTSMAAPVATGVVALWLQHNAALNVDSVRALLHASALHDSFTGAIPASGSNLWGWGKIDAFGGLSAPSVPYFMLDAETENYNHGIVIGRGRHPQGMHEIEAVAQDGYRFLEWSDGNSDNPRTVDLTSDTSLVAAFAAADCDTISQFPWEAVINETSLNCWDLFGDNGWDLIADLLISISTGVPDNWLATPHVLVELGTSFFFECNSRTGDSVAIVAITGTGDTTVLADELYDLTHTGEKHVDLTPFAGQVIRLGFHHHAAVGAFGMVQLVGARIDYLEGIENPLGEEVRFSSVDGRMSINNNTAGRVSVRVYDALGRQVATVEAAPGRTLTAPLPSGIYVVKAGDRPAKKIAIVR